MFSQLSVIILSLIVVFFLSFLCFISDEKGYLSEDYVDRSEVDGNETFDVLTPEFLNTLTTSGLPNHKIKLKTGTPIMLLRNIDQSESLCNGTRLIVTRLANHVIEAKVISGKNIGAIVYISRMEISPTQSPWPFKLSMTINKSQGQSLDYIFLRLCLVVVNCMWKFQG